MSTRGSYKIEGITMYNHWDNYPSGAALMFFNTLKEYHNLNLFSFIRSNKSVELSHSLNKSGEEFSYEIKDNKIFCYSIDMKTDKLIPHSSDYIDNWVNSMIKDILEKTDKLTDYQIIKCDYGYYTESQIIEEAKKKYSGAVNYTESGSIGNGSSLFADCFKWCNFLPENFELNSLRKKYLSFWVPFFVTAYKHDNANIFNSYAEIK